MQCGATSPAFWWVSGSPASPWKQGEWQKPTQEKGGCPLFLLATFRSGNSLSSGFGMPVVETLEISTWGEALDSVWD